MECNIAIYSYNIIACYSVLGVEQRDHITQVTTIERQ